MQRGLEPSDWKPFPAIGPGVVELRIHTTVEYRVMYVAKFEEGLYVLHAFEKRSRQPRQADVELAKTRLRDVLRTRRSPVSSRS